MVVEKEEFGLSLSLSFPDKSISLLNLNHSPFTCCPLQTFPSSDGRRDDDETCRVETSGSFLKGIDVNCLPEEEEDGGVSSPNSTISSLSGKRSSEVDRACSRSDEEDADNSRKKLRLSKDQSNILEQTFKDHHTLNPKQKLGLAKRLGLRPRQVEVWFQNRRARTKLKQTEVDCEYLKRCCENLTDENRRLQKEVQQLRALKLLSPQLYMQMTPPTTLTICPSCHRSPQPVPQAQSTIQTLPFNPWATAPTPFDALLHSRS